MALQPIFPNVIKTPAVQIADTDGTTDLSFIAAGPSGSRIDLISAISTDTVECMLSLYLNDGTTNFGIGQINIPAGSGTDGVNPVVSVLNLSNFPYLKDDLTYYLQTGYSLRISAGAALSAGAVVTLTAVCGEY